MNMIKALRWRFEQCSAMFTILLGEGSSETGLFRNVCVYVFEVRNFVKTKSMRVIFFSKCSNFHEHFKNAAKNLEKGFSFWDNGIWIRIVKLSLLLTGYFSSGTNVLTSSPKILHVNKRDFFQLNWLDSYQRIW